MKYLGLCQESDFGHRKVYRSGREMLRESYPVEQGNLGKLPYPRTGKLHYLGSELPYLGRTVTLPLGPSYPTVGVKRYAKLRAK